jgi:hypothetical protein
MLHVNYALWLQSSWIYNLHQKHFVSRTPVKAFCTSLSGCKCNTAKCHFGDPCLCSNGNECGIGQFMNDKEGRLTHFCSFKDKCFLLFFSYIVLCSTISCKGGHLRIFTYKNYLSVNLPSLSFMNCPIPHSLPFEHKQGSPK